MYERNSMSGMLVRNMQRTQADWQRINQFFNDAKSSEFESRYLRPMLDTAQRNVEWLKALEIELDQALQFSQQPIP